MATPISRDILNKETDARFWAQTGFKPGQPLDPNNPLDKAKMPVWMDIFRKVSAEADAGTLVTTYDRPEVAQSLADAEVASTVTAVHVDAGAKEPDPAIAQQHAKAAALAAQVALLKLKEAADKQPPTASPKLVDDAAREAAKTPPPPHAPAIDQIAHAQMQNGTNGQNGKMLRPEEDPWDSRYVPKSEPSKSPRERPPARPARPARSPQPPREILYKEVNARFWNRTQYKPGQNLDMASPEDRKMAKIWMEILREVEREANEGTLTFTRPDLPVPDGARPPPSRPMPFPQQPMPPPGMEQSPQRPMPMPPPGMQRPMPPPPGMQRPMPPPGMQRPGRPMPPWASPGMQPGMPMQPQPMPPGMQQPGMQQPGMQPGMQQPGMQMPPGMQPPGMQMPPGMQPPVQQPMRPDSPPPGPSDSAPPQSPTEGAPSRPAEGETAPPDGMSTRAKIALGVGGIGVLAAVVYAVTRKPTGTSFRPRARARVSSAFPPSRGGGY